jgi:hypothetical protein
MGKNAKGNNKCKSRTKNKNGQPDFDRQAYANCNQHCFLRSKIQAPLVSGLAGLAKHFPVYSSQNSGFTPW